MRDTAPLVAIRCDGTPSTGIGHVMRCLAVAEGLLEAGLRVTVLGQVDVAAGAVRRLHDLGVPRLAAPDEVPALVEVAVRLGARALVVDSYVVPHDVHAAARRAGRVAVAVVDGPAPDVDADLLVNPNLGASAAGTSRRAPVLAGPDYALLRSDVTRHRPQAPPRQRPAERVVVLLGGTDVRAAAPRVAGLLLATGRALQVDVVCATDGLRAQAAALRCLPVQSVRPLAPVADLGELVADADLVVSAAGTTLLKLACLGTPMALVPVADNQRAGYASATDAGVAVGLGDLERLERDPDGVTQVLADLLEDVDRRARLAAAGHGAVDGRGRHRLARAVAALLAPVA